MYETLKHRYNMAVAWRDRIGDAKEPIDYYEMTMALIADGTGLHFGEGFEVANKQPVNFLHFSSHTIRVMINNVKEHADKHKFNHSGYLTISLGAGSRYAEYVLSQYSEYYDPIITALEDKFGIYLRL